MAKTEVKVFVACGSGVATSTIAQEAVKEIAKEAGVPVKLYKGTIAEVPAKQAEVDLVLTTANYRKPLDKPYMSVFGLVSGVGADKVKANLTALLQQLLAE
ncbi:MAG: PTS sugar transporter subunit IIB [Butyricicoccus sp.]